MPCSNPDLFRSRDVLGTHVPTATLGTLGPQAALPGRLRSFALVWWETYVAFARLGTLGCCRSGGWERPGWQRSDSGRGPNKDLPQGMGCQTLRIRTHCTE